MKWVTCNSHRVIAHSTHLRLKPKQPQIWIPHLEGLVSNKSITTYCTRGNQRAKVRGSYNFWRRCRWNDRPNRRFLPSSPFDLHTWTFSTQSHPYTENTLSFPLQLRHWHHLNRVKSDSTHLGKFENSEKLKGQCGKTLVSRVQVWIEASLFSCESFFLDVVFSFDFDWKPNRYPSFLWNCRVSSCLFTSLTIIPFWVFDRLIISLDFPFPIPISFVGELLSLLLWGFCFSIWFVGLPSLRIWRFGFACFLVLLMLDRCNFVFWVSLSWNFD